MLRSSGHKATEGTLWYTIPQVVVKRRSNKKGCLLGHPTSHNSFDPGPTSPPNCLSLRLHPDVAFVHQVDLLLNDLFTVLVVLHGFAVKVEVFGINRLFVEHLVEFGA